ncbi:hypothetical protein DUNSADRAFT_14106 [Dunaliella salina]|uniref:Uncharacterized protein n=1 Tax=Dunaliella salina TaxID=3046 RepID=A0ABQ7G802_DUNSA|nr:hypothetical protein DUNSADRAFT_14106 [Dunaliella salina]|eukprot:KAF5830724.1 hypothetical protein DUNSADRAFT_14106 [Dunaliella salina]
MAVYKSPVLPQFRHGWQQFFGSKDERAWVGGFSLGSVCPRWMKHRVCITCIVCLPTHNHGFEKWRCAGNTCEWKWTWNCNSRIKEQVLPHRMYGIKI